MKRILGIGNALVDRLAEVSDEQILVDLALPKGSMQLLDLPRYRAVSRAMAGLSTVQTTGGSACNTILAVAALGGVTGLIGRIGQDEAGTFFSDYFRTHGVETRLLTDEHLPTGVASTFITPDGQRTFGTYLGAASRLCAEELRPEWFVGYDYFYIEGYLVQNHELITQAVELAHAAGLCVCLDLASYNIVAEDHDFFTRLMPDIDIVFANEQEAIAFTGVSDPLDSLHILSNLCDTAVVKVGKRGVYVRSGADSIHEPALEVPHVVDTTAAGDYFSAGFLYARAAGYDLGTAARLGSLLAGRIIEVVGTALSPATWQEIRATLPAMH